LIASALALVAIATTVSATDVTTEWFIGDHQTVSSDTLNVYANISVTPGGQLDLTSVDIIMMGTMDGQYTILVETGGKLTMNGGSISADQSQYRYKVEISGSAIIEGVTISDTWGQGQAFDVSGGGHPTLSNLKGGIQIYNDNVYIGNSTLSQGMLCMIFVGSGASPTIYGNTIHNVTYDVRTFSQSTSDPSSSRWSAMAFGVLMDRSSATIDNNDFYDIGKFSTMASVYYRDSSINTNEYQVIAAAVAARSTVITMDSNNVANTGVLDKTADTFPDGGNTVNQRFYQYRVAGFYGYMATGTNIKLSSFTKSTYGGYIVVNTATTGGPMTFDVIVDNVLSDNSKGGLMFDLVSVSRDCTINVSDNEIDRNGEGATSGTEDCGLVVSIVSCSGNVDIIMKLANFRNNDARGVFISAVDLSGYLKFWGNGSNTFSNNGAAGLLIHTDTVQGDIGFVLVDSTFTDNNPQAAGDPGAIGLTGGSNTGRLEILMAIVTSSGNTGSGLGINLGGLMSVNLARNTKYIFYNCAFSYNTDYGIYIFDSYGANAQQSTYDWENVHASNNRQGVYVHSNSQLGNIAFKITNLTANDNSNTFTAVTFQMAAANYQPKSLIKNIRITYAGAAPSATGLALQGVDENKRWIVDIFAPYITQPRTALDAQFCEVTVNHGKLEGDATNSIVARDSMVHLYYCDVPDLSAVTMGTSVDVGVLYYKWINITLVAWQNGEPIRNQTVVIKRFRDPQDEVYSAVTNAEGMLPAQMRPFWEKDENDRPLRNDELQAFVTIRGDTLNSLWFDFNDTVIGIDDPDVPDLVINSPGEGTVQKSGILVVQGEIRDSHSGVKHVEVTVDSVVWWPVILPPHKIGDNKAPFSLSIYNLTDGVYTITIRGWDVARYPQENLSYALETVEDVKIDTQPPALQVVQPPTSYETTNNGTYKIVGHTERSINIRKLTINDTEVLILGTTFSLDVTLHEGSNFFVIIAEDTAGNIAVSTREIILDTLAPTLIVSSPIGGFSSNERDFEVSGDTEQTAMVYVKLDNLAAKEVPDRGGTRFYYVLNIKDEGTHMVTVISEDVAGNIATESILVRYDITPPVLEDIVPGLDNKPTNQQTLQVSGRTDTDVTTAVINGLRFKVQDGQFFAEINLLEGQQQIVIQVEDAAGNTNSTIRNILIDVTPPQLRDLTVSSTMIGAEIWPLTEGLVISERSVRFRGRLVEGDILNLYIQVEADNRSAIMDEVDGLSFYRDFNLDEGENRLTYFATDIAGNRLQLNYILDVDPRAPTLEYFNPRMSSAMEAKVDEDTVFISGQVTDKGIVTLKINNRQVLVHPDTGAFQTNVPLEEGLNNIPVEVIDRAGNKANDLLHITYEPDESTVETAGDFLISIWWAFAVLAGLAILIPITVWTTRDKWIDQHPELENWDPKMAKDGLYEYEEDVQYVYEDQYQGGGGN
jgi:hypothetical protein